MKTNTDDRSDGDGEHDRGHTQPRPAGSGPLIAMICLGILLLGGLVFSLVYFLGGDKRTDSDMLACLPADSNVIGGVEVEEYLKNAPAKELLSQPWARRPGQDPIAALNEKLKPTGLTVDDFSRVLIGGVMDKGGRPTVVARAKKPFDKAKMAEVWETKSEQKRGDKTYYTNDHGDVLYFPSDTLIVWTFLPHLEQLITKDPAKVAFSDDLQQMVEKMSKGTVWFVGVRAIVTEGDIKKMDMARKARLPYVSPELLDAIKDGKAGGIWAKMDKDSVQLGLGLLCANKETADKVESSLKKEVREQQDKNLDDDAVVGGPFKMLPEPIKVVTNELKKSLAVDRSGALVEISTRVSKNDLEKALSSVLGEGPPPDKTDPFAPPVPTDKKEPLIK